MKSWKLDQISTLDGINSNLYYEKNKGNKHPFK